MELLRTIAVPDTLLAWLAERQGQLRPDVSRYARGRMRQWLVAEWILGAAQLPKGSPRFKKVHPDFGLEGKLWQWVLRVCEKTHQPGAPKWVPDIGILTYSGEHAIGIDLHRDDSYSQPEAWAIQLTGTCDFTEHLQAIGFTTQRRPKEAVEIQVTEMTPGMVAHFNCKNPHAADPSPDRWALNLWTIKPEFRNDYLVSIGQGHTVEQQRRLF